MTQKNRDLQSNSKHSMMILFHCVLRSKLSSSLLFVTVLLAFLLTNDAIPFGLAHWGIWQKNDKILRFQIKFQTVSMFNKISMQEKLSNSNFWATRTTYMNMRRLQHNRKIVNSNIKHAFRWKCIDTKIQCRLCFFDYTRTKITTK